MAEFDVNFRDEFFRLLEDLLNARGLAHEASILSEATKEISEFYTEDDWGNRKYYYSIKLCLPTLLYAHLQDRTKSERNIEKYAHEIFRNYDNSVIRSVDIVIDTASKPLKNPESSVSKIAKLRSQIIDVCGDEFYFGDDDFVEVKTFLIEHVRFAAWVPGFVKNCAKLSDVPQYVQKNYRYDQRTSDYLYGQFEKLIELSEQELSSPVAAPLLDIASRLDATYVLDMWRKALNRCTDDPEGAITAARTLLESVSKHILEEHGVEFDDKLELPKLFALVAKQLNLSPSQHTEEVFKKILGSSQSIVDGLGSLRNKLSDAHGKTRTAARPAPRHAEFSVNLAGTLTLFLLQTNEAKLGKH